VEGDVRRVALILAVTGLVGVLATTHGEARPRPPRGHARTYLVIYAKDVPIADARAAILRAGGSIVLEDRAEELATVRSSRGDFVADVDASPAILGAAPDVSIGTRALVPFGHPSLPHAASG
jgi:hypothetical protein